MAVGAASVRAEPEAEAEEAPPAPARHRRWVLLAAPLLLGLVGTGLWFEGWLPRRLGLGGKKSAAAESGPPVTFAMPELVANLAGDDEVERYVKVDIRLVVAGPAALAAVRARVPELQDLFLTYLRDMHVSELQSSIGTWRLREELLSRAAIVVGPGRVTDILFTNLLIQ
jgi:flagellar protein FliL